MNNNNTYIKIVNITTVFLLLGLYLLAILFPSLHQLAEHSHEDTTFCSTDEVEQDPCHQKVYHHNATSGCQHNTHLHTPKHSCKLCDVIPTQTHTFYNITFDVVLPKMVSSYETMSTQILLQASFPSISQRGPPFVG